MTLKVNYCVHKLFGILQYLDPTFSEEGPQDSPRGRPDQDLPDDGLQGRAKPLRLYNKFLQLNIEKANSPTTGPPPTSSEKVLLSLENPFIFKAPTTLKNSSFHLYWKRRKYPILKNKLLKLSIENQRLKRFKTLYEQK